MKKLLVFCLCFLATYAWSIPSDYGVDYDIVYVRYPGTDPDGDTYIKIPQGESAYTIAEGADLMLLSPDGTEEVLVDCDNTCSVMDPYISYDATHVYYSKIEDINLSSRKWNDDTPGYLYKINLAGGAPYTEIQLTYPETFEDVNYAGNTEASDSLSSITGIRDMSPVPLSDGRILFTSNRSSVTQFNIQRSTFGSRSIHKTAVQQMFVMDDHDGTKNTSALANLKRIENSNLSMVQHPMQLKDGRILFTTWLDFGHKFAYSVSPLFTMHPDGSNLQQFTEPHDHSKFLDHFITQLGNGDVVWDWYYPSYDYGYGVLVRTPVDVSNGEYLRGSFSQADPNGNNYSKREFDRPNTIVITPHTSPKDEPAPNASGKYAMPSWAKNGHMLVAYSTGNVNWFNSKCSPDNCENLKSGIYLFLNAETSSVTDPTNTAQLAPMIDSASYNEIWPRAVVPYNDVFGQSAPDIIASVKRDGAESPYIAKGEPAALVGTSSMLIRESDYDYQFRNNPARENHGGEWKIQGTDVGVFNDSEVYGVRILKTPELPFTSPVSTSEAGVYHRKLASGNPVYSETQSRYASAHNESWEILGEFPLTHKAVTDPRGNPDTSWWAKVPSDTPTTIQAIDINGMTLYSETVWRSLAAGEERTDCAGCHAHSVEVEPMDWSLSQAGQGAAITGVTGVSDTDTRIAQGFWDLTAGTAPWLDENGGVEWTNKKSIDIEYTRDVLPILTTNCHSCHTDGGSNGGLVMDGSDGSDLWYTLSGYGNVQDNTYVEPQMSKYIRSPQARASQFVWVAWGQRLDGRTNSTLGDDVDYPDAHPAVNLSFDDRRTIARWVDLGLPINFTNTEGFGYTDDNQLPIVEIYSPKTTGETLDQKIRVGVQDAQSDINWSTLSITYYDVTTPGTVVTISTYKRDNKGVVIADMPSLTAGNEYVLTVSVEDSVGNTKIAYSRFQAQASAARPTQPAGFGAS